MGRKGHNGQANAPPSVWTVRNQKQKTYYLKGGSPHTDGGRKTYEKNEFQQEKDQ